VNPTSGSMLGVSWFGDCSKVNLCNIAVMNINTVAFDRTSPGHLRLPESSINFMSIIRVLNYKLKIV